MRRARQLLLLKNSVSESMRFHLNEMVTAALICSTLILTQCPDAYSRSGLRCGDELRIETQEGTTFQGKLLSNNGDLLALWHGTSGLHTTIALGDAANAFRVKRRTGRGILIGSVVGTAAGLIAAKVVWDNYECEPKQGDWGFGCIAESYNRAIATFVLIPLAGAIVGGSVGWLIGHSIQRVVEVQLEALPMCFSPSGDTRPFRVSLAVNF